MEQAMRVAVFGAGYVGLVTGVALAYLGHRVELVEVDAAKLAAIDAGRSPIFEAGLEPLLGQTRRAGRLTVTADGQAAAAGAEVIFIAVGTPPTPSGQADLRYVQEASRTIGRALDGERRRVVVNKATVPIGSANLVEVWMEEGYAGAHGGGPPAPGFTAVVSNPEFLREGSALSDTLYPDRIVVGFDEPWAGAVMRRLYRPILEQAFVPPPEAPRPPALTRVPLLETDRVSAEMIKYAANAFLATKISFANEMANICERVGADVRAVMQGIGMDSRIGTRFLQAGVGWGGSCFGKDMAALLYTAKEYGYQAPILEGAIAVNRQQRLAVVQRLKEMLRPIQGRRIAVWGLAFKPGTDDLRDAPAVTIIEELVRLGVRVQAYDPVAGENFRRQYPQWASMLAGSPLDAVRGAEALVLVTEWPEFAAVPLEQVAAAMARPFVLDGRNFLDQERARAAGLVYRGMGLRPSAMNDAHA